MRTTHNIRSKNWFKGNFCEVFHRTINELTGDFIPDHYTAVAIVPVPEHLRLDDSAIDVLSYVWINTQNHRSVTGSWRDSPKVEHSVEPNSMGHLWSCSTSVGDLIRLSDGRWFEVSDRGYTRVGSRNATYVRGTRHWLNLTRRRHTS